jgi:heat-inducible transcriptional repressor
MNTDARLNRRAEDILYCIIREYIETGEPVGSRTIARQRPDGLSAASIRNAMADLADEGFLSQPHTSAGRVPTAKAFRQYVRNLNAGRMAAADSERLRVELSQAEDVEDRIERSSRILSELTHNVGIAIAMPDADQLLDQIELILLPDRRVLMVLATRDRMVQNRVIHLDEPITVDELASIRNYVNRSFSGWRLSDARRELMRRMEAEQAAYDAVLRKVSILCQKGLLQMDSLPEIHLEGASNLVGLDLHLTREKLRDLFRALEEKRRLVELLDRFLEAPADEPNIQVGLEAAHPAMGELALIGMWVTMPGGFSAKVAVLGPMRMQYERVMSAVLNIGRAFKTLPI